MFGQGPKLDQILHQQRRIEAKLDALLKAFDIDQDALDSSHGGLNPDIHQQIQDALAAGQKIKAIKILRGATNMSLKDAKQAVESGTF